MSTIIGEMGRTVLTAIIILLCVFLLIAVVPSIGDLEGQALTYAVGAQEETT